MIIIFAGLLKIMSKMGISVISSYRGGCNFEAVGLSRAIVSDYFPGMSSRISGIGIIGIEKKIKELHEKFNAKNVFTLPIGGLYRYRKSGEDHQPAFRPDRRSIPGSDPLGLRRPI
mgnify:CR=1 FL=1